MTSLGVAPVVSAEAHPGRGCSERVETLLEAAREQRWIPLDQAVGIVIGVLCELQKPGAGRVRVSGDTVWIRVDGRILLVEDPGAHDDASADATFDGTSRLEAVGALLERLASVADLDGDSVPSPVHAIAFAQIRARAISTDPDLRYGDEHDLRAALDHFALEAGLDTSDGARARFLFSLLGATKLASVPDASTAPLSAILLRGRVEDRLAAASLAAAPGSRIVLDFATMDRLPDAIASSWLALLATVSANDDAELWLARIPPGFVRQAMQLPSLLDSARVASIAVVLFCRSCGSAARRVLDVERDRDQLHSGRAVCPRCAAYASLDQDDGYLGFIRARASGATPDDVRAAMAALEVELAWLTPDSRGGSRGDEVHHDDVRAHPRPHEERHVEVRAAHRPLSPRGHEP